MNNQTNDGLGLEIGDDFLVEIDGLPTFLHYAGVGARSDGTAMHVFSSSRRGYVLLTGAEGRELLAEEHDWI